MVRSGEANPLPSAWDPSPDANVNSGRHSDVITVLPPPTRCRTTFWRNGLRLLLSLIGPGVPNGSPCLCQPGTPVSGALRECVHPRAPGVASSPLCLFVGLVPGAVGGQSTGRGGEGAPDGGGLGGRRDAAGLPVAAAGPAPAAPVRQRPHCHRPGAAAGMGPGRGRAAEGQHKEPCGPSSRVLPPQAIHMETDPQTISAYLVYLSQHTPVEEQGQHSDLALVRGWDGWSFSGGVHSDPGLVRGGAGGPGRPSGHLVMG